jgi:hypothetical protein
MSNEVAREVNNIMTELSRSSKLVSITDIMSSVDLAKQKLISLLPNEKGDFAVTQVDYLKDIEEIKKL